MKDQEIIIFKENKFYFQPVYKRYAASKEGEIFLTEDIQKSNCRSAKSFNIYTREEKILLKKNQYNWKLEKLQFGPGKSLDARKVFSGAFFFRYNGWSFRVW